jgi:5-methyltetrahydropteroyltriglutamate--homocysteine methyltransferase
MKRADLRTVEDEAIAGCVKMQEDVGLDVVTDGEFRRENCWINFISAINGIEISAPDTDNVFQQNPEHGGNYVPKNVLTTGKIGGGSGHEHYRLMAIGDEVELEIEKIGVLRNKVIAGG